MPVAEPTSPLFRGQNVALLKKCPCFFSRLTCSSGYTLLCTASQHGNLIKTPACWPFDVDPSAPDISPLELESRAVGLISGWSLEEAFGWLQICYEKCGEVATLERERTKCRIAVRLSERSRRIGDKHLLAWLRPKQPVVPPPDGIEGIRRKAG